MTVRLRLQRHGAKKRPFYRLVAADQRCPRDGRFIEMLGTYDPLQNPPMIRLDGERVDYWVGVGAQPSNTFRSLIRKWKGGKDNVIDLSQEGAEQAALAARAQARKEAREAARKEAQDAAKKAAEEAAKAEEEAKAAAEAAKAAAEAAKAEEEAAKAAQNAGEDAASEGTEETSGDDTEKAEES